MFLRRTAIGAALIAAPLAFAAPAIADNAVTFDCAPCVGGSGTPIWEETLKEGPWEPFFKSTSGDPSVPGAWEKGVKDVNGGSWEKAFPPKPAE
jgi:hypothetical protein